MKPQSKYKYMLCPENLPNGTKLPAQILCTRLPPPDPTLGFANLFANPEEYWEDCIVDIADRCVIVSFPFGEMRGKTMALPFDYGINGYEIKIEKYY